MRPALAGLALAAVLAGAWGIRTVAMQWTFPVRLLGDERYYVNTALNIAQGRGHVFKESSRLWRPPAHAWLLSRFVDRDVATHLDEVGDPVDPALHWRTVRSFLRVEILLSTLLVGATAALGWLLFNARVALGAAALAALYPNFIAYSHYLWSETLFSLLIVSGLAGVAALARRPRGWAAPAALGLVFGVAGLTREIAGPIALAAVGWWWLRCPPADRGGVARRGALLLAVAGLTVLPWTLRNYTVHARFIPVSSIGWFAAAQGNALEPRDWLLQDGRRHVDFEREYFAIAGEAERMDFAREKTFEFVASEQPTWLAKKAVLNLALLFTPDSYVLYKIRRNAYRELDASTLDWLRVASIGGYAVIVALGVIGFAGAPADGRRLLPLLVFGVVGCVHILANADTRFRLPWMPIVIVYASFACVHSRSAIATLRSPRHWLVLAPLALFLAGCLLYFLEYGGRR